MPSLQKLSVVAATAAAVMLSATAGAVYAATRLIYKKEEPC